MKSLALHVFSDACHNPKGNIFAGAYIVGRGGTPVRVLLPTQKNIQNAELELLVAGLAASLHEKAWNQHVILHTDLSQIHQVLRKAQRGIAAKLNWMLKERDAHIVADAWNFPEYEQCHHHARIKAGILGTKHPALMADAALEMANNE